MLQISHSLESSKLYARQSLPMAVEKSSEDAQNDIYYYVRAVRARRALSCELRYSLMGITIIDFRKILSRRTVQSSVSVRNKAFIV